MPTTFNTTSGRPWLIDLNDPGLSANAKGMAFFPALVLTALYFFDHNVSALLTHRIEYKLKKPVCYNWDFMVLGVMMIICGILGLPPCNGLIPNSPMHSQALVVHSSKSKALKQKALERQQEELASQRVQPSTSASDAERRPAVSAVRRHSKVGSLADRRGSFEMQADGHLPPNSINHSAAEVELSHLDALSDLQIEGVVDQRLSNLLQSGLVAVVLLILPVLALVPTSVVTGLFLFMGVESLMEGDLYARIMLPIVEQRFLAVLKIGPLIHLDRKRVHLYTLIQLIAFGIVFFVTRTVASIIFPVLILLLIPLRFRVLKRVFDATFIDVIDQPLILPSVPERQETDAEKAEVAPGQVSADVGNAAAINSIEVSLPLPDSLPTPDLLRTFYSPPPPHSPAPLKQDLNQGSLACI